MIHVVDGVVWIMGLLFSSSLLSLMVQFCSSCVFFEPELNILGFYLNGAI